MFHAVSWFISLRFGYFLFFAKRTETRSSSKTAAFFLPMEFRSAQNAPKYVHRNKNTAKPSHWPILVYTRALDSSRAASQLT